MKSSEEKFKKNNWTFEANGSLVGLCFTKIISGTLVEATFRKASRTFRVEPCPHPHDSLSPEFVLALAKEIKKLEVKE